MAAISSNIEKLSHHDRTGLLRHGKSLVRRLNPDHPARQISNREYRLQYDALRERIDSLSKLLEDPEPTRSPFTNAMLARTEDGMRASLDYFRSYFSSRPEPKTDSA